MSPEKPAPTTLPLLAPASRAELRSWLAENHASSSGVNLAIGKKGNLVTSLTYDEAVEEGLAFGWIDSVTHALDEHRYVVRFTPRRRGSIWARSNKERVARLEAAGLMTPAGLALVDAARADGSWDTLTDAEGLVIPDDLTAALSATPHAAEKFAGLSASAKRQTLYWIASAKRAETRSKRIAATVSAARESRSPV